MSPQTKSKLSRHSYFFGALDFEKFLNTFANEDAHVASGEFEVDKFSKNNSLGVSSAIIKHNNNLMFDRRIKSSKFTIASLVISRKFE